MSPWVLALWSSRLASPRPLAAGTEGTMAGVHPASDDELIPLRWFDHSGQEIVQAFQNGQDVLCNWTVLGVHPRGSGFRLYAVERSADAIACIDGDGLHFGAASSPSSPEDRAEFLTHHQVIT